jgi:transposase IS4-like protein/DDE family transposase
MLEINKEVAAISQEQPTQDRLRGLKRIIPSRTIKSILKRTNQTNYCRRLPKWFMVWFVIGLGLFATNSYQQVFRWLRPFEKKQGPGRSTFCESRLRLGVAPFRLLYEAVVHLLATAHTAHAYYRNMLLMSLDGFVLDLPDRSILTRIFGKPQSGRTAGAFPQARVLALCETGAHVLWRFLIKPIRRSEMSMTPHLLRYLKPDMLLLWDRAFLSYANVVMVLHQRAHLLGRVKKNVVTKPIRRLSDGSFLAKIYPGGWYREQDRNGVEVRVIEYTFNDPNRPGAGEKHRLLTTLLNPKLDPAKKLIELYHERWEEELTIDELKTHLRERPVLRSETPTGVVQEIYGLLLGHYVVRKLMFEASQEAEVPPRNLSFTNTLKILRCRLPEVPKSRPRQKEWYRNLLAEIGEQILEKRRDRINPRVIRRKMSHWDKKRPKHYAFPQPTKNFQRSIVILN